MADPVRPARPASAPGGHPSVLAKPPVRKLARELGVDLAGLAGTGPGGSISRDDVQQAAGARIPPVADPAIQAASPGPREERIPIRGVRKHTAAAVAESALQAPHVTEFLQVEVDATVAAVRRLRELPEFAGVRVSPLLLVARALLVAVARHPMINSSWDEDAQEIVVKHYVNLGIAAATERGLIVPNIRGAHVLTLPALARALAGLAETARAGRATPADLCGGTITITNVGVFGVDAGTPILTPPEAAILAFGQVKDAPWVHDGQLAVRKVTTLSLSFDHRIVDGDLGSAVLRDIGAMLHDPTAHARLGLGTGVDEGRTDLRRDPRCSGTLCCSRSRRRPPRSSRRNWRVSCARCPGPSGRSAITTWAGRRAEPGQPRVRRGRGLRRRGGLPLLPRPSGAPGDHREVRQADLANRAAVQYEL